MTGGGAGAAIRAVIADDEPSAREVLRDLAAREPRLEIVGEAANGDEAVEKVLELEPDLLFLDIQMPDRDGFGVLRALGGRVPRGVIFVTAHDEYALRAFEVRALDYLLKPFGRGRFQASVERALETLGGGGGGDLARTVESLVPGKTRPADAASAVLEPATPAPNAEDQGAPARIGVRRGARTILVAVDDIDWVEAADDYSRLHVGDESHLLSTRMHELERGLRGDFLRIHRSAIVNLERVAELRRDSSGGGVAVLRDGVRLRVARSRWEDLERALGL